MASTDLPTGEHEHDKVTVDTYGEYLGAIGGAEGKTQITAAAAREALKDKGWGRTTTVQDVHGHEKRVMTGELYRVIRGAEDAYDKDVKAEQARYADIPPPPPEEEVESKGPTVTPVEGPTVTPVTPHEPTVTPVEPGVVTIDEVTIVGDARKKDKPAHGGHGKREAKKPEEEKPAKDDMKDDRSAKAPAGQDKPAADAEEPPAAAAESAQDIHLLSGNLPPLFRLILSLFPEDTQQAFSKIFADLAGNRDGQAPGGPEREGPGGADGVKAATASANERIDAEAGGRKARAAPAKNPS